MKSTEPKAQADQNNITVVQMHQHILITKNVTRKLKPNPHELWLDVVQVLVHVYQ